MPRPRTKEDLMIAAKENYYKLNVLIAKLSDEELNTPLDFSSDEKKKEAHWKRDKNLRDILQMSLCVNMSAFECQNLVYY